MVVVIVVQLNICLNSYQKVEIRHEALFNSYNTLIMWLEGKIHKEILTSGLFRLSRGKKVQYVEDIGSGGRDSSLIGVVKRMFVLQKEIQTKSGI